MDAVATLFALISIIAILGPSTGLKCKTGAAIAAENSTVQECPEGTHYCVTIACSRANLASTALIVWTCTDKDNKNCSAEAKPMVENQAQETVVSCECTFGEKDKDWTNAEFALPQPPEQNATAESGELTCKKGQFDAKGLGNTYTTLCIKGSKYCFAAKCTKEGHYFDTWGCTSVKNSTLLNKALHARCNYSFGGWMVQRGNENLIIPAFLAITDPPMKNWRTGKDLSEKETQDVPLQISPEGECNVIYAKSIHKIAAEGGVVPDMVKLYFNGGSNDESRKMILNICVPRADGPEETCKDGLIFCFVGQMDPENAPVITQFQLKNYVKNNKIATKCENAQAKWHEPEFDGKKLHGFQIAHVGDKLMLSSSTSLETVTCNAEDGPCCEIRLGEPGILGGYVVGQRPNESDTFVDKAWRGGLLRQEDPVSALTFDLLGAIPQGGGFGIIADKCDMQITLEGEGLLKCLGKKCEDSNPEKNVAKTLAPKEEM
uniref:Uncharacterized protein n=1 Tax=Globodera rostochiensis TaxID=31243 RepID=A0A914HRL8_GLORO